MRTITISTRSWHWRLQRFFDFETRYATDLCAYTRGVLGALFLAIILLAVLLLGLVVLAHFAAWIAAGLLNRLWPDPSAWVSVALIGVAIGIAIGFVFAIIHIGIGIGAGARSAYAALPVEQQVTLADWWGAFREKICFRVNYL